MKDIRHDFHVLMVQDKIIEYSGILLMKRIILNLFSYRKTSSIEPRPPHVTIREKGFMGQLSKIVWLSGIGYFETLDDQSVTKIGRHLLVDIFREIIKKEVHIGNQMHGIKSWIYETMCILRSRINEGILINRGSPKIKLFMRQNERNVLKGVFEKPWN